MQKRQNKTAIGDGGGAGPRRPRFTSRAATEGSSDVRFPVSLVPDTRRLSPARAARAEGKSWELRSPRDPLAQGVPPKETAGLGREGTSASRPSLRLPADRPPRSRSFHHALAGLLGSGVFPTRRCADPGSPRGARHRHRLRVRTGLLGSGARRGRGQGRCADPPGWAVDQLLPALDCGFGFAGCTENLSARVCA